MPNLRSVRHGCKLVKLLWTFRKKFYSSCISARNHVDQTVVHSDKIHWTLVVTSCVNTYIFFSLYFSWIWPIVQSFKITFLLWPSCSFHPRLKRFQSLNYFMSYSILIYAFILKILLNKRCFFHFLKVLLQTSIFIYLKNKNMDLVCVPY